MKLEARLPFGQMLLLNMRKPEPEVLDSLFSQSELQIVHLKPNDLASLSPHGLPNLRMLSLRNFQGSDLKILKAFPQLKVFELWQSPKTTSLIGLEQVSSLSWLNIAEMGEIESLEPIASLAELTALLLTGCVWKSQWIRGDLTPLAHLQNLQRLSLSVEGQTDLTPLLNFPKLNHLWLNTASVPVSEVVKLAARYPFWHKQLPWIRRVDSGMDCPRCASPRILLMLRKTKRIWCESCESKRLSRVLSSLEDQILEVAQI